MVVAEILTGISLVKQAHDFIKSNIDTCKDIGELAGSIDDLFRGEQEAQKARAKKSKFGFADQMGVETVAQEIIDAKLAAERLAVVAVMVDLRFGHGTWASIKAERQKRIEEAKQIELAEKKQRALEKKQQREELKMFGLTFIIVIVVFLILFVLFWVSM
tara:strand:+ start:163 stop:642 length:480 start_codon:yes stop_codon:yes gene_type:complete